MLTIIIGALLIGLALGLLGSGGSTITVPILVYLVGHTAKISIAESMAIVGLIALSAAIPYSYSRLVHWNSVFFFGLPAVLGTVIGAALGGYTSEFIQLATLGGVLLLASGLMCKKAFFAKQDARQDNESKDSEAATKSTTWMQRIKIFAEGCTVGILTGFVGVGGGFLIVPALIALGKIPIRIAIGTSLVIIAAKSAVGFAKYVQLLGQQGLSVDWWTIVVFAGIGILGSFIGRRLNSRLNQQRLKQVFAVFLMAIGLFILIREGIEFSSTLG